MSSDRCACVRSLLFVPAEKRRLSKIGKTGAGAYIIDLEDSIGGEDKADALEEAIGFLSACATRSDILVRINRERRDAELRALKDFPVGFVLPKFQSREDYSDVARYLENRVVVALIESPRALVNAFPIASLPWVDALAFGAEDYTAAVGMANTVECLQVPKSMVVIAAKAAGKRAFDTPCFRLDDKRLLESELRQAKDLGFDGKLAIHPKQLAAINMAFGAVDVDRLRRVVEEYEASGRAVCEIDGAVYEKLHIDRIKELVADGVGD